MAALLPTLCSVAPRTGGSFPLLNQGPRIRTPAHFMFAGTFTALVTPFRNDQLDEPAFRALVEAQVAGGVTGIVPVGTTGESPTLTHLEHLRVFELAVQTAQGRVKVMAGTGSNSTAEAIEYTREAERIGADAALIVAPYY